MGFANVSLRSLQHHIKAIIHGVLVSIVIAIAAQFLAEHYKAPAMLLALLLGMAFHFLAEQTPCMKGIEFSAKTVLRIGVALLGARISVDYLIGLGPKPILLLVVAIVLTILFGFLTARLLRLSWKFGFLSGGAVAICGASAAMAIASILPKHKNSERDLLFAVISVTILSTIAMVIYPLIAQFVELDNRATGIFLGGAIHDVAQVVGAGFSISDEVGDTATLVKLIRVSLLAPVILIASIIIGYFFKGILSQGQKPPLLPPFILFFIALAGANSLAIIPAPLAEFLSALSRWMLLIAIAAVGMKTSLSKLFDVGGKAVGLVVLETAFLAMFIYAGVSWL